MLSSCGSSFFHSLCHSVNAIQSTRSHYGGILFDCWGFRYWRTGELDLDFSRTHSNYFPILVVQEDKDHVLGGWNQMQRRQEAQPMYFISCIFPNPVGEEEGKSLGLVHGWISTQLFILFGFMFLSICPHLPAFPLGFLLDSYNKWFKIGRGRNKKATYCPTWNHLSKQPKSCSNIKAVINCSLCFIPERSWHVSGEEKCRLSI